MMFCSTNRSEPKCHAATRDKPSIAVLPFNNMSGDPEQEYFSDGITEDIITDLSKVSGLSVIARHSSFSYKGKPLKVQQIGRELGVDFMLEGSVRKAGARVRVTGNWLIARKAVTFGPSALIAISPTFLQFRTRSLVPSSNSSKSGSYRRSGSGRANSDRQHRSIHLLLERTGFLSSIH